MAGFDLHIHSALSACAENELSPGLILRKAAEKGLAAIAITDHNAVWHAVSAFGMARGKTPAVIPGVELTSREEVHLLAYFADDEGLLGFWAEAGARLPPGENRPGVFGYQVCYDRTDTPAGIDQRLRQQALDIGLDRLVESVRGAGGLAVPAHVDRRFFSLLSQLGFVDPRAGYDALEVSRRLWLGEGMRLGCRRWGFSVISGSDSHDPGAIGVFRVADPAGVVRDFASLSDFLGAGRRSRR